MSDEFRFAISPVVQEANGRRLVDMMASAFSSDGATSEDLRREFELITGLKRQSFYDALAYCKHRGWITGGGKGVVYRLSDDGSWKLPQTSAGEILERDQLEHTVHVQSQQVEKLQGEVERLRDWSNGDDANGANVALGSLLRIVSDGSASPRQRVRAASAVLGYKVHDDSAVEFVRKFLQAMCMDAGIATDYKIEAGELLRKHESPRIASESVKPNYAEGDTAAGRTEAWRVYERWQLRKQIILETHQIPPKGYDAHLKRDTYAGPPEGNAMPPVRVVEDPVSGFRLLDNLLPKKPYRIGNGRGGDEPSEPVEI